MEHLFQFTLSPLEIFVRGTLIYWFLFFIFRFFLRRDAGSAGVADLLFIVLLGDAAQNGMIGDGKTVADSAAVIATLAGWNYLLDALAYHVPRIARFTDPPPLCLIRNGRVITRNLRRQFITHDELLAALRNQGLEKPEQVYRMYLEASGQFTVVKAAG
jgi:uncharacterized membrane protein YcaP (DUF421 family)